ncbi:helix-turn-helix domain-containing protein [Pontibacillus sp. ALD_SL1]|uniref:PucR family transcriptional regulator n=1 Tax=Pontibacillus sp. ALD_SL1 TaxID=2777185 RepID=UPI001A959CBC|nr:helix-turn-helix domain-containing protein [Pontibacillus sp. ALD_SL1]QSS98756.1 helix-turn-helix domain-containing protein [Pontibacillus sp. ALD_SL1]
MPFNLLTPYDHLERIKIKEIVEPFIPLVVLPYQHYIVCIVPFSTDRQFPLQSSGYTIGVGEPQYSLKGIRTSFRQARDAITLGEAPVSYSADLYLERLIHTIDQDIYEQTLSVHGKRLAMLEPNYVDTLQELFRHNLRMTETAKALHIHRNTLIYRLDQFCLKVGLAPRNFKEAALLTILLVHEPFVQMHK